MTFGLPTLEEIWAFIGNILNSISSFIYSAFKPVADWMAYFFSTVTTFFADFITKVKAHFDAIVSGIATWITNTLGKLQQLFQSIYDAIYNAVAPIVERVGNFVRDVYNYVASALGSAVSAFSKFVTDAATFLINKIADFIAPVVNWFQRVSEDVKLAIGRLVQGVIETYDELKRGIQRAFDALLSPIDGFVAQIAQQFTDVKEGFMDAAIEITGKIAGIETEILQPLRDSIKNFARPFIDGLDAASLNDAIATMQSTLSPNTLALYSRQDAQQWAFNLVPKSALARTLWVIILGYNLMGQVYGGIAQANGQVLLQEFAQNYHYQLLSPADATLAVMRGDLSRVEASRMIVKQGYAPEDAERIIDNAQRVPEVGELLAMRLRGLVSPEQFQKAMVRLGFSQSFENAYKELSQIIPPVGDLIHFAVKGAFSDKEIAEFGYMEDFPQDIVPHAEKQGLSETWMRRYWAAHWQLPSATQGFEMLHRDVIKPNQLQVLLRALDYPPAWRQYLTDISYNVLTRVDVRRLHQLGLMDREKLVKAHKDMGYNETDAQLLTAFVEELNKGKPGESDEELGKLSRSNIVNFYQDGVIKRERAIDLLVSAGFTAEAATLFIDTADFDAERAQRAAEIDFVIASAVAGVLDFGEAQDELARMKLSPTELDRAAAKLLREQAKQTKLPTADDGAKMFKARVISEEMYRDLLKRLGYRAAWVDAFVALQKVKA